MNRQIISDDAFHGGEAGPLVIRIDVHAPPGGGLYHSITSPSGLFHPPGQVRGEPAGISIDQNKVLRTMTARRTESESR